MLKYARWTGSEWGIETISSAHVSYAGPTSIALDANGWPHIVYLGYEGTNYVLKYAKDPT
jgi:hypothetical protein